MTGGPVSRETLRALAERGVRNSIQVHATTQDWRVVLGLLDALAEAEREVICGLRVGNIKVGCGKPIASIAELYRCATCDVAMHKACLHRHFNWQDDLPPTPSNVERITIATARAEAAEAVVERQREALAEAIRFLEDVAPPNDTTRNRISAALMCLREAANGALL